MFEYINGKVTDKSVITFSIIWAVTNTTSKYVQGASLLVVLMGSAIVGGLFALLIGKIFSLFTKNKQHTIAVANWLLLVGSGLTLIVALLPT